MYVMQDNVVLFIKIFLFHMALSALILINLLNRSSWNDIHFHWINILARCFYYRAMLAQSAVMRLHVVRFFAAIICMPIQSSDYGFTKDSCRKRDGG